MAYQILDICTACGNCEPVCPENAITEDVKEGIFVINPDMCTDCGSCASVCPVDACVIAT